VKFSSFALAKNRESLDLAPMEKPAGSAPAGPAPRMVGDTGLEPVRLTHSKDKDLCTQEKSGGPRGAKSGALSAQSDLADLARALAALPKAVRESLLSAVNAAQPQERKV
jgi:hypothetical protein